MANPDARLFCLAILIVLLFCWPARAVPSAPWPAGNAINAIDQSPKAPSLAAFRGRIYMVWKADDRSNRIYIAYTWDGVHWSRGHPINTIDATPETPALVASINKLYIAFKANDGSHGLRITASDEPSIRWPASHEINSLSRTAAGPVLYNFNGHICLAWTAEGTNLINFLELSEPSLTGLGHRINTDDRTTKSPALASWNGKLYLAWKTGGDRIFIASSRDGATWSESRPINSDDQHLGIRFCLPPHIDSTSRFSRMTLLTRFI